MPIAADLYALQELDTAIDACDRKLEQTRAAFGENAEAAEARIALAEAEVRLRAAQAQTRELETQIGDLQTKIGPVERKLYDGSVTSPKELQALQEDLDMLKRQQRGLEDQELAAMAEQEGAAAAATAARERVAQLEAAWRAAQGHLHEQEQALLAEREQLMQQREARVSRIDSQRLALYDRLRSAKRGVAVAKVERGLCMGCRITLPTTIVQRARSGMQVVQCTSCERILYAG
jgi:predicted  nucleic acid-binding Zn-ribbon protein